MSNVELLASTPLPPTSNLKSSISNLFSVIYYLLSIIYYLLSLSILLYCLISHLLAAHLGSTILSNSFYCSPRHPSPKISPTWLSPNISCIPPRDVLYNIFLLPLSLGGLRTRKRRKRWTNLPELRLNLSGS